MGQAVEYQTDRVKTRILVAPLDWGLGHATRCVTIIRELLARNCEVWIACDGMQKSLLQQEFPELPFLQLDGYGIEYARTRSGLFWKILFQLPAIRAAVKKENKWLDKIIREHGFKAVLSDNRFGLYHDTVPCIFITHQLNIKSPLGKWSEQLLRKWNYQYIDRFSSCWIPDVAGNRNLAGELSHPAVKPKVPLEYIGPLSRFSKRNETEVKDHLLIVLSGPEPQRTILENKIIREIAHYNGTATIVRGLPASLSVIPSTNMIRFYNHLSSAELNSEMEKAEWVVGRCGYSTVMDLVKLQKKSILIPTPGQTEQEYLAKHLMENNLAYTIDQKNFSLSESLSRAKEFKYEKFSFANSDQLSTTIKTFIESLTH